jgi:hypothetical protein
MPYIKKEDRELIDEFGDFTGMDGLDTFLKKMDALARSGIIGNRGEDMMKHPGTLNYIITRLVVWYLGKNPNYERYNAAIGALECAKQELYRRQIAPYEDEKCEENGDVYQDGKQ